MAIKSYNGVTYDDKVDYSAAIEQAKAAGQDTSGLEASRDAKVNDPGGKYKGNEPNMYGSNQKYSDVRDDTSDDARQTISNAVQISSQVNGYDYTKPSNVSSNGEDYYGGQAGVRPDMSRNLNLAGMSVKQGHYTVTYDEDGYATRAVKDDGASATGSAQTSHANDTVYHQLAYKAAEQGDWDLVGQYLNMIADTYSRTGPATEESTGVNMKSANLYGYELQNQFGYNAETYYNQKYDEAYGKGSAAVWDATGGAVKTYAELANAVGAEKAQQIVTTQMATNPPKYQATSSAPATNAPAAQPGGSVTQGLGATLSSNFGNGSGIKNGMVNVGGGYDLSDVIRSQKEAELEAKLANLKGAFNKSEASLNDALAKLPQEYDNARNEVAAQHAIAQRAFDERAAASGLNSGTSGQAALARNSVLQKNLAEIGQRQADAASEIELQKALLTAELEAAITEALAQGESELAAMLYEEMIRVQELEREDELIDAQQEAEKNELALKYAAELGLDASDLLGVESSGQSGGKQTQTGGKQTQTSTSKQTQTSASNQTAKPTGGTGYNNGVLTTAQVKTLQEHINQYLPAGQKIAVDGKWGPATQAAAGGFTADEYAREYYRQNAWSGRSDR